MMVLTSQVPSRPPAARLYLVTPPLADAALDPDLSTAIGSADVAAVLLRLAPAGEREMIERARKLAPAIQGGGAALLLESLPDLVARAGADGAHLSGVDALRAALPRLKPDRIAGAGGLRTRHDAMLAAEAGADYVMFGEPDPQERRPALDAIIERVAWWAELFVIPCVAFAGALDEIAPLSAAGADFVALGDCVFADPRGIRTALAEAAARLAAAEPVG
jgi:thiamine-phosphate pyrophosphorylase